MYGPFAICGIWHRLVCVVYVLTCEEGVYSNYEMLPWVSFSNTEADAHLC